MAEGEGFAGDLFAGITSFAPENLLKIIWKSKLIVLGFVILSVFVSVLYLKNATKYYTSTSMIYIEQNGPKILDEKESRNQSNYLNTQAELLKSTPILTGAIDIINNQQGTNVSGDLSRENKHLTAQIKSSLSVSVGKKNDIISITFSSPNPEGSAQILNAIVESYISYNSDRKRDTAAEVLKILQKEKDKRSKELMAKLEAITEFKKNHPKLVLNSKKGEITNDRLASLSEAMTKAQLETMEAEAAYKSIEAMMSDPVMLKQFVEAKRSEMLYIVPDDSTALKTKLNQLERQLDDLLRSLTTDHPVIIGIEKKISKIKGQITKLDLDFAKAQVAVAKQKYLITKQKEEQITSQFDQQRQQALELNEQHAQYALLQSDWEQIKNLCDILDNRIKEIDVTDDAGALNINILEKANPALCPSRPQRKRTMAMALFIGLMLGSGTALLCSFIDPRFRNEEDIMARLGMPILGIVPSMSKRKRIVVSGRKAFLESASNVNEAFRRIRTSILFNAPKNKAKTLLVTSAETGDGKTTIAGNLAITMAQAGQKTLLIDTDFRKPMLDDIFKVKSANGLTDIIARQSSIPKAISKTTVKGLSILHCGQRVSNPSELLSHEMFARVLRILACQYDRIILDSSSVTDFTDAQILGSLCDTAVFVINARKSTRDACYQAHRELLNIGTNILGAVVNDVGPRDHKYGFFRFRSHKKSHRNNKYYAAHNEVQLSNDYNIDITEDIKTDCMDQENFEESEL